MNDEWRAHKFNETKEKKDFASSHGDFNVRVQIEVNKKHTVNIHNILCNLFSTCKVVFIQLTDAFF